MGYRVLPDGTTSDMVMLRGWNSGEGEMEPLPGYWDGYVQASAAGLAQWRFAWRSGVAVETPVHTVAVMTLCDKGASFTDTIASKCAKRDGVVRMQFARSEENWRGHSSLKAAEASK